MQDKVEVYGMGGKVDLTFPQALERAKEALKSEGFGVLCEIDVQATLKAKLNVDRSAYVILGACNPSLAHQALQAELDLGLLLPCNVVVYEDQGSVWVKAIEPGKMLSVVGNPALEPVAKQVREKLERVLAHLAASPSSSEPT
ncbi:MAG TPA: DUF302 domain-containing protein [Oscillatoriaceae cyanobacterium]